MMVTQRVNQCQCGSAKFYCLANFIKEASQFIVATANRIAELES